MNKDELRIKALDALSGPKYIQSLTELAIAISGFGESIVLPGGAAANSTVALSSGENNILLEIVWEFIREGRLIPGYDRANPFLPAFHSPVPASGQHTQDRKSAAGKCACCFCNPSADKSPSFLQGPT